MRRITRNMILFLLLLLAGQKSIAQPGGQLYIPIAASFNIADSVGNIVHFESCHFSSVGNVLEVECSNSTGRWKLDYFPLDTLFNPVKVQIASSGTPAISRDSFCMITGDSLAMEFSIDSAVQVNFMVFSTHRCSIIHGKDTMNIFFYHVPFEEGVLFYRFGTIRFHAGSYKVDLRNVVKKHPTRINNSVFPDFNKEAVEIKSIPVEEKKNKRKKKH